MRLSEMLLAVGCGVLLAGPGLTAQPSAAQPSAAKPPAPPAAQVPATPAFKATVEQLAWVAGAWTGMLNDRIVEQHWSAPRAGSIIAMYRSIQGNRATLYELLAIEQEGDGVVLRIKHFAPGPGLVSREAKDESVNNRLVSLEGKTAVFEGTDAANPARITFNSPDPATLNITSSRQRDGKTTATEFKYTRIKP
jgi:hypothetical protein